ncbi:MAG: fatty acid desaturase, partial [Bacillota bacterium]
MPNTLNQKIKPFARPSNARALYQMVNTIVPFALLIVGMYYMIALNVSYLYVVLVSVVPALFLVRIFIMFHDCTHKSFLTSNKAMVILGHIFGILTF